MNERLEILRVQNARIGLKINVKKTTSMVSLGNEKIDQLDSFTYLGSIISKDGGCREDVKIESLFNQPKYF